jgi:hypothetical protein
MSYGQKLDYQTIGIDALQQFPKVNDVKLEDYIIIYMYKYYIYICIIIYIYIWLWINTYIAIDTICSGDEHS